jgi:hypothetical protein
MFRASGHCLTFLGLDGYCLRIRGWYKRFVKTMDSFRESMVLFRFVVTNPDSKKVRFVPYETNTNSFCIVDHESLMFSKDLFRRLIFQRFDLFSRIQRILTNP